MTRGGMMYSKGDIIVINFPFSDLINAKKRPMVVLAEKGEDILGCAITANLESEGILIKNFEQGSLPLRSKIKYWQIHTFLRELAVRKIARISKNTYRELTEKIYDFIKK